MSLCAVCNKEYLQSLFSALAFTPRSTDQCHYGQCTPATPTAHEGLVKRTHITNWATPASVYIQQPPSLDVNMQNLSDDEIPIFATSVIVSKCSSSYSSSRCTLR